VYTDAVRGLLGRTGFGLADAHVETDDWTYHIDSVVIPLGLREIEVGDVIVGGAEGGTVFWAEVVAEAGAGHHGEGVVLALGVTVAGVVDAGPFLRVDEAGAESALKVRRYALVAVDEVAAEAEVEGTVDLLRSAEDGSDRNGGADLCVAATCICKRCLR